MGNRKFAAPVGLRADGRFRRNDFPARIRIFGFKRFPSVAKNTPLRCLLGPCVNGSARWVPPSPRPAGKARFFAPRVLRRLVCGRTVCLLSARPVAKIILFGDFFLSPSIRPRGDLTAYGFRRFFYAPHTRFLC